MADVQAEERRIEWGGGRQVRRKREREGGSRDRETGNKRAERRKEMTVIDGSKMG